MIASQIMAAEYGPVESRHDDGSPARRASPVCGASLHHKLSLNRSGQQDQLRKRNEISEASSTNGADEMSGGQLGL
jgi:hypothetical protein